MAGITCGQLKTSDHTQTVQANLYTYRLNNTSGVSKNIDKCTFKIYN